METLAAAAISLVAPYLAKGADEFARQAGGEALGAVKALAARLQRWWSGEPVAAVAADHLTSDPRKYSAILTERLAADLANDPAFESELQELVGGFGPHIEVIQRIEIATGVTGADIDELLRGTVRVEQDVTDAQDVVGFKAKRVGG